MYSQHQLSGHVLCDIRMQRKQEETYPMSAKTFLLHQTSLNFTNNTVYGYTLSNTYTVLNAFNVFYEVALTVEFALTYISCNQLQYLSWLL